MVKFKAHFVLSILLIGSMFTLTLASERTIAPNQFIPPNIILLIGDGMGPEHVKAARWVEYGKTGQLAMESLPSSVNVSTHTAEGQLTDSAASGTALATGSKTINGKISTCIDGQQLTTITEIARLIGMKTGIVTTSRITRATPATFSVHDRECTDEQPNLKQFK
ncbi:MAG: alkaline phosphatase [Candidatus Heimdallarchaeota archaeon]|nr:alkaline phosphatase [Candidatus Heimdallarchaeota archaeon]